MENNNTAVQNPLGTAPVGKLIAKFAIPAIISMLVSALYNILLTRFLLAREWECLEMQPQMLPFP